MSLYLASDYTRPKGGVWEVHWFPRNQIAIDYAKEQSRRIDEGKSFQSKQRAPRSKAQGKSIAATSLWKKPAGNKKSSKPKARSCMKGKYYATSEFDRTVAKAH